VFPKTDDPIAHVAEQILEPLIANPVTREFGFPKRSARFGYVPASPTSMPETTIREHSQTRTRKEEVWATGNRSGMKIPASYAPTNQRGPEPPLGSSVITASNRSHLAGALFWDANEAPRQVAAQSSFQRQTPSS
jgi:hypothetical protein